MVHVARAVGPTYFGSVGFALAVLLYMGRLADGGLDLGSGVGEVASRRGELGAFVPAVLTMRALLALLVAAGTALLSLALLPAPDGRILALYAGVLVVMGLGTRWVHVGLDRAGTAAIARLLGESIVLTLLLTLVRRPNDVLRVPLAQLAGDATAALLLLLALRHAGLSLRPRFEPAAALPVLRRGWRLMGATILGLAIYNSDLLFLRAFLGATSVGFYAAAYAVVSFWLNLGLTYALSLLPAVTARTDVGQRHELRERALAHAFALWAPVVAGGAIVAPGLIRLLFGVGYEPAGAALRLLIWSVLPAVLAELVLAGLVAMRHERRVVRVYAGTLAITLVLNLAFIPRFGITGAAVATICGELARLALAARAAHAAGLGRMEPVRWWRAGVASALMAATLLALGTLPVAAAVGIGALAYAVALTAVGGIRFRRGALPVLSP
jgi:O-antigen/teichoic acid export membrane protein